MTLPRDAVVQKAPRAGLDVEEFPAYIIDRDDEYFRAHRRPYDAHFRSSSGAGRFDLMDPEGTCYVADSTPVAVREWLGPAGTRGYASGADRDDLQVTVLTELSGRAANVSHPGAARFGVTTELTSMTPYDIPQAWARHLHSNEWDAIRYTARFTPGSSNALALFGDAGPGPVGREVRRIDGAVAMREAGIEVLDPPASSVLTVL